MTSTPADPPIDDYDVSTFVVTEDGQPTDAVREMLAEDGWTIVPSTAALQIGPDGGQITGTFRTSVSPTGARVTGGSGHVIGGGTADSGFEPLQGRLTGELMELPGGPFRLGGEEMDLVPVPPPLLDRARELVNRDVLVIAGGTRVDGRLIAIDEETLLLTVEDQHYRFHVDLQHVAVLAVGRG